MGCRGEAVAGGAGFDDVCAVGDAVDDGGCEPGVGEGPAPFREGRVAHDRYCGALLTLGQDLEEEFGGSLVEVDVAEFVDREEVESAVASDGLGEVELVGCLGEFVCELGAG